MQIFFIRTIKEGYTGCPVIVRFIQRLFKIVLNITKHQSGIYLGTPIHRFNAFLYRTPDPFRTFIIEFIINHRIISIQRPFSPILAHHLASHGRPREHCGRNSFMIGFHRFGNGIHHTSDGIQTEIDPTLVFHRILLTPTDPVLF